MNDGYLDKNYGGILIVWDRLFGSFKEEVDAVPILYGTRAPLRSWNPLWANLQVYRDLVMDSWRATSWADKLRVWISPPGWRPADVAARWPKAVFDIAQVQRYDPLASRTAQWLAAGLFMAVLTLTSGFLWFAEAMNLGQQLLGAAVILALLGWVGFLTQPRFRPAQQAQPA